MEDQKIKKAVEDLPPPETPPDLVAGMLIMLQTAYVRGYKQGMADATKKETLHTEPLG